MKFLRTLCVTALLAITTACTAFASPEAPTDEEIQQAFQKANTVFEWFEHHPLPTQGKDRKDGGYMLYYSVSDESIPNMAALKNRVHEVFTDALSSFIISGSRTYREFNGKLYVAPDGKPLDPHKGTNTFTIIRKSPTEIDLEASTPMMEDPANGKTNVVKVNKVTFPYVKTEKGWRFSYFESLE